MKFVSLFCLLEACSCMKANGADTDALADFKWFSTLGLPDVKELPFVQVATGHWSQREEEPPQNHYRKGFLLATNADAFTVLTLDLAKTSFTNTTSSAPEHKRVGFELLGLGSEAMSARKALQKPPKKDDSWQRFGEQITQRAEVFVLAWGCWRQGLETEAQSLYDLAKTIPAGRGGQNEELTFRKSLEKDLGYTMMWNAILDFEDVSISRPQLLVEFERIQRNFPRSEHRERAQTTAEVLKRMVAEDQTHRTIGSNDFIRLPVNDQIRELIFLLRDQNGRQTSQPGWCDIFEDWRGATNTPAHRLVDLEYAAVPQLIATLDVDTLSRSVGYHRDFYFSHTVLTVGDCALQILERIAGRSFFIAKTTSSYMSKDGEISAMRRAADAWWSEFQKKGEKQMLIDSVSAAGNDAPAQAERLVLKYPDSAAAALIRGAQATTNSWIRGSLILHVSKLADASAMEFLKTELVNGPTIQTRVAAAYGLRQQGQSEAIPAMIREWEELRPAESDLDDTCEPLIEFLASCDSVESVSALAKGLRQRSPDVKLKVIEALGETNRWFFDHRLEAFSARTLEAIETSLVTALEDTDERMGMSGWRNGKDFTDPRICDMAACLLAERWPQRYTFDLSASANARDRQRKEAANVWRVAHSLPAVPIPQSNATRIAKNEANKVTNIEWSAETVPS